MKERKTYYCAKCKARHIKASKIGRAHRPKKKPKKLMGVKRNPASRSPEEIQELARAMVRDVCIKRWDFDLEIKEAKDVEDINEAIYGHAEEAYTEMLDYGYDSKTAKRAESHIRKLLRARAKKLMGVKRNPNTQQQELAISHLKNDWDFGDYWVKPLPSGAILVHTDKHKVWQITRSGRIKDMTPENYQYSMRMNRRANYPQRCPQCEETSDSTNWEYVEEFDEQWCPICAREYAKQPEAFANPKRPIAKPEDTEERLLRDMAQGTITMPEYGCPFCGAVLEYEAAGDGPEGHFWCVECPYDWTGIAPLPNPGKRAEIRELQKRERELRKMKRELKEKKIVAKKPTLPNVRQAMKDYQELGDQINDLKEERDAARETLMAYLDEKRSDFETVDDTLIKRSMASRKVYDDKALQERLGDEYPNFVKYTEYYRISLREENSPRRNPAYVTCDACGQQFDQDDTIVVGSGIRKGDTYCYPCADTIAEDEAVDHYIEEHRERRR